MKNITGKQIKAIYALSNARGFDNDFLHDIVSTKFGKISIKALTAKEAIELIDFLDSGKTKTKKPYRYDLGGRIETQGLRRKMYMLTVDLGWEDDVTRIGGFVKKQTGTEVIQWLTVHQCNIVIEGLKKIIEKQSKEE